MNDLPDFRPTSPDKAREFAERAFHAMGQEETSLIDLTSYPDHHFRAIFRLSYFTLGEGQTSPSKSQWNTLKKRLKRMQHNVFVFKDCGEIAYPNLAEACGFIEFGFLPA